PEKEQGNQQRLGDCEIKQHERTCILILARVQRRQEVFNIYKIHPVLFYFAAFAPSREHILVFAYFNCQSVYFLAILRSHG
ncbi:MAG: hypothetical protein PVF06_06085, partial [Gammaproteobacteria bacterium]